MPKDTNYMQPMIFGGKFLAELDLCAAQCVNRFLHDSECESAVTYHCDVKFLKPCYVGDLVFMTAKIVETRTKSIRVHIVAERERRGKPERDKVAEGDIVFVSILHSGDVVHHPEFLPYAPHGMKLDADNK